MSEKDMSVVGSSERPILELTDAKTYHVARGGSLGRSHGTIKAVDGVTLSVNPGETLGLVGESGCGKSTLARTIVGLDLAHSGSIRFEGREVVGLKGRKARTARRRMQMVFQDPQSSLDGKMRVADIVTEGMTVAGHRSTRAERRDKAEELLSLVGLRPDHLGRYPHEMSGGQRQRVGIARALAIDPTLVIADESVSALDMSVQSQILNLLTDLQAKLGLTYVFIAHNLSVVEYISDRIGVMYLGRIVEMGPATEVSQDPLMPYTLALNSAIPGGHNQRERIVLRGELPNPLNPPSGCGFRTRCWRASDICAQVRPELLELRPGRFVACHHPLIDN